jgi:cobalamin biosynthesis Mg chelatase CobN
MSEPRQETGGPNRTPRSEIGPVVPASRKKEPVLLLDLSTSMDWSANDEGNGKDFPDEGSRRAIVINALPLLVKTLEDQDSEAAGEQAGGDDEKGGLLTFGFANEAVEIGDLNSSNLKSRLNEIQWGGRTYIMPAWKLALADYDEEFGDRDPADQPVHLVLVVTDGQADDFREFDKVIESASAKRVIVVAIVGHGTKARETYDEYTAAAKRNTAADKFGKTHVHVVSFDGVTDPAEIGEDLATLAS